MGIFVPGGVLGLLAFLAAAACGGEQAAEPEAIPDAVAIVCTEEGPELDAATVRPRPDGVHVRLENRTDRERVVMLENERGTVSELRAGPGETATAVSQLPPGTATVSCVEPAAGGTPPAGLEVQDPDGVWRSTRLECERTLTVTTDWFSGAVGEQGEPSEIAGRHLPVRVDDVVEPAGYPESGEPVVRVVRDGRAVATVWFDRAEDGGWLLRETIACEDSGLIGDQVS